MKSKSGIRTNLLKNNKKSYTAQVRVSGYPNQTKTFRSLTQAKDWQKNKLFSLNFRNCFTKITLKEAIEKYKQKLDKNHSNFITLIGHLTFWEKALGTLRLDKLTEEHILEFRNVLLIQPTRYGKKRSLSTVNRYITTLRTLLNYCIECRILSKTPIVNLKQFREPSQGRNRILNDLEVNSLLKACRESKNKQLYDIVFLALYTGMRKGEILYLKVKDVFLEEKYLKLEKTKNGDSREIPLSTSVLEILKKRTVNKHPQEYIFSNKEGLPLCIRSSWEKALKIANIKNFVFHSLRATCVSLLSRSGCNIEIIAKIVGHRDIKTTYKHYTIISNEEKIKYLQKISKKIG